MRKFYLTGEEMDRLGEDTRKLMEKDKAGCDTRTILKDIYCDFYQDKTEDIGYVMADKVVELVGEYEQEVFKARENPDVWMDEKIESILEGKISCTERCNTLYKVRMGLTALEITSSKSQAEADAYVDEHSNKAFTSQEATKELEQKLKEELKTALGNNGFLASALEAYTENAGDTKEGIEYAVIKCGEDAAKYKAILAMKAYLETGEDGYLKGVIPEEATLKDITYSVCAGMDTLSATAAVERGEMEESAAAVFIRAIGVVVGLVAAVKISATLGVLAAAVAGGGSLSVLGGIVVAAASFEIMAKTFMKIGGEIADGVREFVCFGAKCVSVAGRMFLAGVKKLAGSIPGLFKKTKTEDAAFAEENTLYTEPVQEGVPDEESEAVYTSPVLV